MKLTPTTLLFAGCALLFTGSALAQGPITIARMYENQLRSIENQIVPLVEAMPADKMSFAPTQGEFKGVRSFADQAKHVAAVNYMLAAAAKGQAVPVDIGTDEKGPDSATSREAVAKFLKDSFAYARSVAQTLTAENQTQMIKSPFGEGQMARGGALAIAVSHSFDHYGQMVVYARMNGVVPPASRR
jgi:uncharacterized damage-inducible protein DinB